MWGGGGGGGGKGGGGGGGVLNKILGAKQRRERNKAETQDPRPALDARLCMKKKHRNTIKTEDRI